MIAGLRHAGELELDLSEGIVVEQVIRPRG
jgi:hypothetical protein